MIAQITLKPFSGESQPSFYNLQIIAQEFGGRLKKKIGESPDALVVETINASFHLIQQLIAAGKKENQVSLSFLTSPSVNEEEMVHLPEHDDELPVEEPVYSHV